MRAFGYARNFEQDVEGADGLVEQRRFIKEYARGEKIEIVQWFEDTYTETETFPPGFKEMIAEANGVRTVIVEDLNRLGLRPDDRTLLMTELASLDITLICAATDEYATQGDME